MVSWLKLTIQDINAIIDYNEPGIHYTVMHLKAECLMNFDANLKLSWVGCYKTHLVKVLAPSAKDEKP